MAEFKKNKIQGFWNTLFRSFAMGSKHAFSFNYWKSLPKKFIDACTVINFLYSIKVAIACILGYVAAELMDLDHSLWAPLATLMVMQIHMSTSLELSLLRLFGTIVGVVFGLSLTFLVPPNLGGKILAIAIAVPVCAFLELWEERFKSAGVTAVFILLLGHTEDENTLFFGLNRVLEVGIGSLSALLVSILLWPASAASVVEKNSKSQFADVANIIKSMTDDLLKGERKVSHRYMFRLLNKISNNTQKFYQVRNYELAHIYREYPLLPHSVRLLDELRMHISTMMDSLEVEDTAVNESEAAKIIKEVSDALIKTLNWIGSPSGEAPKPLRILVEDRAVRFATVRNVGFFRECQIHKVMALFEFYNGLSHAAQAVSILQERIIKEQSSKNNKQKNSQS